MKTTSSAVHGRDLVRTPSIEVLVQVSVTPDGQVLQGNDESCCCCFPPRASCCCCCCADQLLLADVADQAAAEQGSWVISLPLVAFACEAAAVLSEISCDPNLADQVIEKYFAVCHNGHAELKGMFIFFTDFSLAFALLGFGLLQPHEPRSGGNGNTIPLNGLKCWQGGVFALGACLHSGVLADGFEICAMLPIPVTTVLLLPNLCRLSAWNSDQRPGGAARFALQCARVFSWNIVFHILFPAHHASLPNATWQKVAMSLGVLHAGFMLWVVEAVDELCEHYDHPSAFGSQTCAAPAPIAGASPAPVKMPISAAALLFGSAVIAAQYGTSHGLLLAGMESLAIVLRLHSDGKPQPLARCFRMLMPPLVLLSVCFNYTRFTQATSTDEAISNIGYMLQAAVSLLYYKDMSNMSVHDLHIPDPRKLLMVSLMVLQFGLHCHYTVAATFDEHGHVEAVSGNVFAGMGAMLVPVAHKVRTFNACS
jgi:hypothetical protein